MRRIMLPTTLLAWVEVDLDAGEVVDVRVSDLLENYGIGYPGATIEVTELVDDKERSLMYPTGLCRLDDFPEDRDQATAEETIAAGRIAVDSQWPVLRIEESLR